MSTLFSHLGGLWWFYLELSFDVITWLKQKPSYIDYRNGQCEMTSHSLALGLLQDLWWMMYNSSMGIID